MGLDDVICEGYTIYVDFKGFFSYKLKKFGRYNIIKKEAGPGDSFIQGISI